ncbi:SAM-dependent methyltransferase [Leptospira fletcheri]|uniref:S-adenosyl-L-methionine-dependent methyltransferase n=1 Tax=Leptospira fletcheri TaxID=2484981 RepID=A0A4R9GB38_9LEPT|nr:class I SAM-dependent methyltransferase [Leptospira fletcheri]TGK08968.1 SAM-dependent methyltransferase [Leptospira fletcheri]
MQDKKVIGPESSAVRVALWRAMHVQIDSPPHLLEDEIGLKLTAPDEGWRQRPDMHPAGTAPYRASIVARARFIEDLVLENCDRGVNQYVILGAGLDTFAQRRPSITSQLRIFEVDQPGPQAWKKQRLVDLGFGIPDWLHFVPVDFEAGESWWNLLEKAGFDQSRPAVVASTGVTMYLTQEAIFAMLRQIASLAPGSTLAMTFILPLDLIDSEERPQHEAVYKAASAAGTPFLSFFRPPDILDLARKAGFSQVQYVSAEDLTRKYFVGRSDGLKLSSGEAFLIASV